MRFSVSPSLSLSEVSRAQFSVILLLISETWPAYLLRVVSNSKAYNACLRRFEELAAFCRWHVRREHSIYPRCESSGGMCAFLELVLCVGVLYGGEPPSRRPSLQIIDLIPVPRRIQSLRVTLQQASRVAYYGTRSLIRLA